MAASAFWEKWLDQQKIWSIFQCGNIYVSRDLLVTLVKNIGPEGRVKDLPRDLFGVPASLRDQIIAGLQNIIT